MTVEPTSTTTEIPTITEETNIIIQASQFANSGPCDGSEASIVNQVIYYAFTLEFISFYLLLNYLFAFEYNNDQMKKRCNYVYCNTLWILTFNSVISTCKLQRNLILIWYDFCRLLSSTTNFLIMSYKKLCKGEDIFFISFTTNINIWCY